MTAPPGRSIVNMATVNGGGPEVPSVVDEAQVVVPGAVAGYGLVQRRLHQVAMMLGLFGDCCWWSPAARPRRAWARKPTGSAHASWEITSDCNSPYFSKRSSAVPPSVKSGMINSSKPSST